MRSVMKIIKLLLFLAVIGVAYQYWTTHQPKTGPEAVVSANGFIALPSLAGADPKQVVVFAPENCPKESADGPPRVSDTIRSSRLTSVTGRGNVSQWESSTGSEGLL